MSGLIKTAEGKFTISLNEGSIGGAYRPNLEQELPPIGTPADKNFTAELTIEINEDFASYIRQMCADNLDLGLGMGSLANQTAIYRGMMRAPIPMAEAAHGNGKVPEMASEDIANMSADLDSVQRDHSVTMSVNFPSGGVFSIILMPDARGFNVELVDPTAGMDLAREHPFVLINAITVNAQPDDMTSEGPPEIAGTASFDDARIFIRTEDTPVNFAETLTNRFVNLRHSVMRGDFLEAYVKLINEMFWRNPGTVSCEKEGNRPWSSKLYGVGVSGLSFQVVSLSGLSGMQSASPGINMNLNGTASVQYIYGDIAYPASPMLSASKPKFDIIDDSEKWTSYGPTSTKYVGGDASGPTPEGIFSWEGRRSIAPKKLPRVAAQLEKFD